MSFVQLKSSCRNEQTKAEAAAAVAADDVCTANLALW